MGGGQSQQNSKSEFEKEEEGTMISRQMLINVLVGTVVSATLAGQTEALHAADRTTVSSETDPFTEGGYHLVWADEFSNDGAPNPKNWAFEEGFVRNNEAQWYQKQNARCKNGMLVITGGGVSTINPSVGLTCPRPCSLRDVEHCFEQESAPRS